MTTTFKIDDHVRGNSEEGRVTGTALKHVN